MAPGFCLFASLVFPAEVDALPRNDWLRIMSKKPAKLIDWTK
jgi:hypothetical protein